MDIKYKNKKIKKICTDVKEAQKEYGAKMTDKIHLRIDQMVASESVEFMIKNQIGRCHLLTADRKGQYAVDLVQPYRLIFKELNGELNIVEIMEITDYH